MKISAVLAIGVAFGRTSRGGDWPTWRGSNHDGQTNEKAQLSGWPKAGPPVMWTAKVGVGGSSVTVANGRAFTMGHIVEEEVDKDVMYCLDAVTGKELWRFSYPQPLEASGFPGGPCVTPCVDDDRVYTTNKRRRAFCFDVKTGKLIWDTEPEEKIDVKNPKVLLNFGGYTASPFIHNDLLITGYGALEKTNGKSRWTFPRAAMNASPLPCKLGDKPCVLLFCDGAKNAGVSAASLEDGKELWHFPIPINTAIADPVLSGDKVFISWRPAKEPKMKCALLKIGLEGAEEVWRNGEISSYYHECILWDGYLYGCDETNGLRCIDFKTGETKWTEKPLQRVQLSLIDGKLLILKGGALIVANPTPDGYRPVEEMVLKAGGMPPPPVLANGYLFCRTTAGEVMCLDVTKK